MKIHNVRLGFATNSSSSHSIIFDSSIEPSDDYEDFGWEYFTVSSLEGKQQYLSATLSQNLSRNLPEPLVMAILRGLGLPELEKDKSGYGLSVDHQSLFNLPFEYGTNQISVDFFNEFKDYLLKDGIHILGGNDNDEDSHFLYSADKEVSFGGWAPDQSPMTCRKDGDWWTLYSRNYGNRVVLTFNDNAEPYKPLTPALIDVKITDYCNHGCAYCYQGSTTDGKHMKENSEYHYSRKIADAKVFEIAIGGGEPTQCPQFVKFAEYCNSNGIVVNFTTKSTDWLEDESRANQIIPIIGAFAYSADANSSKTLDRIHTIFKYRNYDMKKFTVQIIPATMNEHELKTLLTNCHTLGVRVTLLGFKETGRGSAFKSIAIKRSWNKFDETKWLDVLKELYEKQQLPSISIDTTMASRYQDKLETTGIPNWMYHIEEGKYSMYLDLVNQMYGPSSYHLDKLLKFDNPYDISVEKMFNSIDVV